MLLNEKHSRIEILTAFITPGTCVPTVLLTTDTGLFSSKDIFERAQFINEALIGVIGPASRRTKRNAECLAGITFDAAFTDKTFSRAVAYTANVVIAVTVLTAGFRTYFLKQSTISACCTFNITGQARLWFAADTAQSTRATFFHKRAETFLSDILTVSFKAAFAGFAWNEG